MSRGDQVSGTNWVILAVVIILSLIVYFGARSCAVEECRNNGGVPVTSLRGDVSCFHGPIETTGDNP